MSEDYLVQHCAPTLAGIKTGSLFTCPLTSREELLDSLRRLNKQFQPKGIRIIPLRFSSQKALIYLYRPSRLATDLSDLTAVKLLRQQGYDPEHQNQCVVRLARRIRSQKDFPHEIGLFLGYPPEDVCGFMENKACHFKCTGCWKVYSNEESAQKTFAMYKKCTRVYREQWAKNRDIERLTVAG